MYIVLALMVGVLVITSVTINGKLAQNVGLIQAGITNFTSGLISSLIYIIIINGFTLGTVFVFKGNVPFYYYLGGAIASLIMLLNSVVINNLPAVYVTIIISLGQLTTGIIIDYIRLNTLPYGKILGCVIIGIGLYVYIIGDKKSATTADNLSA